MKTSTLGNQPIDIINYLSIDALEKIGILAPTEEQIFLMEKLLRLSMQSGSTFNNDSQYELIA